LSTKVVVKIHLAKQVQFEFLKKKLLLTSNLKKMITLKLYILRGNYFKEQELKPCTCLVKINSNHIHKTKFS